MVASGLLAPTLTPLDPDGGIDTGRLAAHAAWLLRRGCHGVLLFGTTGEATSFATEERQRALEALLAAGMPAQRLMVGIGTCNLPETVALGRHALAAGVHDLLVLPPFYYKGPEDDGLIAYFEALVAGLGGEPRIHLYHIPPVAGVGFSVELVGRLRARLPQVVGLKDSSGDLANTLALLEANPEMAIFCGSEAFLLETLKAGGAGCITATANINAAAIRGLLDGWQGPDAAEQQAALAALRRRVEPYRPIPAMKALLAELRGDPDWRRLRPPFLPLSEAETATLLAELQASNQGLPELRLDAG